MAINPATGQPETGGMSSNLMSIGAGLGGMLFGGKAPDFSSQEDILKQYLGPFAQYGIEQLGPLTQQFTGMAQQPGQSVAQLGAGFQQDPGYQFNLQQAMNAANQAAAAGGMAGTPAAQQQAATAAGNVANQAYQQYLQNVMGQQQAGLQGLTGLQSQGAQAAVGLGGDLASIMQAQAKAEQAAQQARAQSGGGLFGGLLGAASNIPGLGFLGNL